MVAMVKAGVELAFECMTSAGMLPESAYYESLHETPLIANTIARKKLYEMNVVISDTAEYGCYLFDQACRPLLKDFMSKINTDVIGRGLNVKDNGVDNRELIEINDVIRTHPVEIVGKTSARLHDSDEENRLIVFESGRDNKKEPQLRLFFICTKNDLQTQHFLPTRNTRHAAAHHFQNRRIADRFEKGIELVAGAGHLHRVNGRRRHRRSGRETYRCSV